MNAAHGYTEGADVPPTKSEVLRAFLEKHSTLSIQLAASAWTQPSTAHIPMDPTLCLEFAKILYKEVSQPNLGNATTAELLEELRSRLDVDRKLNYKTTNYPPLP